MNFLVVLLCYRSSIMHTDPSIYTFLATDPEAFRVLTGGLTLPGAYIFRSIALKSLELRLDGLYEPDGHTGPVYAIKFQARAIEGTWYNPLAKIGLYGEEHPGQEVRGLLIFLRERADPWRTLESLLGPQRRSRTASGQRKR